MDLQFSVAQVLLLPINKVRNCSFNRRRQQQKNHWHSNEQDRSIENTNKTTNESNQPNFCNFVTSSKTIIKGSNDHTSAAANQVNTRNSDCCVGAAATTTTKTPTKFESSARTKTLFSAGTKKTSYTLNQQDEMEDTY
jgi:hypothetical protein